MNRKLALTVPLLFLLCFGVIGQVWGQTRAPGVVYGDYFLYQVRAYYMSSNQSADVPVDLLMWNQTVSYKITVSAVIDTNVTTEDMASFANGTQTPTVVIRDTNSGAEYLLLGLISEDLICANLTPNDSLYGSGNDQRRINGTISMNYGAVKRDANSVSFDYPVLDDSNNIVGISSRLDYYDKATGALVFRYENTVSAGENVTIVASLKETNLWAITGPLQMVTPTPSAAPISSTIQIFGVTVPIAALAGIIVVVAIVVIVPIVVINSRKNKKKRRHR
jgi:hypothetical protein